eukprot:1322768-Pleurochrysis_carterae.AAC.1
MRERCVSERVRERARRAHGRVNTRLRVLEIEEGDKVQKEIRAWRVRWHLMHIRHNDMGKRRRAAGLPLLHLTSGAWPNETHQSDELHAKMHVEMQVKAQNEKNIVNVAR